MKPWTLLDTALTPDGKTITLHEHDGSRSIRVDGQELMSTRQHASEEKLAQLACAHLKTQKAANVLIGGLGFGFTLRAALEVLPRDATVVVAEILEAVIRWNGAEPIPRASIIHRDVVKVIQGPPGTWDAILLDPDNGPQALTAAGNQFLYDEQGLKATLRALKPGGCAAWWSAAANPLFAKRIARAGFTMESQRCGGHTIFLGRKR